MKSKIENIILLILSIIAILLGLIILVDLLDLNASILKDTQFSLILIALGIISFIMSLYKLIKKRASNTD